MDPFGTGQVLPPLQVPQPSMEDTIVPPLKKPPKWERRPVGASFGVSVMYFINPLPDSFFSYLINLFFVSSVWWKADNLRESKATSDAEPSSCPQASVCEPGYHGDRVPPALQGAAGGAAVGFFQQLLPGQDSERQIRCRTRYMEVPFGKASSCCSLDILFDVML